MTQKSNGYFDNPYFSEDELKCQGTGELNLAPGFLGELIFLRESWAVPLTVNSCCRSPEHNEKIGGHKRSLHLTQNPDRPYNGTMAIDISTRGWSDEDREDFQFFCEVHGWSVGVAETFIHLDRRIQFGLPRATFYY